MGSTLTFRPNVVVLDLGLPDTAGADVVRRIREQGEARIVVFSAWHRLRDAALAAGADAFVLKPDVDTLQRVLMAPPSTDRRTASRKG
jgi:DNA-binding response OmpR family regulator